jgi:titin
MAALTLIASSGTALAAASATAPVSWFHDPISAHGRAAEVAVPAHPSSATGVLRPTKATDRSHSGSVAVPLTWAAGHALVAPQAVVTAATALFSAGTAKLSPAGRQRLASLVASLSRTAALTCEGYGDYAGSASAALALSRARAAAACALIHQLDPAVVMKSAGYGGAVPVLIGGRAADRGANSRLVFVVTKSLPPVLAGPRLTSVIGADGTVAVSFAAPAGLHGVVAYQVSTDGGAHWALLDASGDDPYTALLTGLTNGTRYDIVVRAVSTSGTTAPSNHLVVTPAQAPPTVPSAPNQGIATAGDGTAALTFWAPDVSGGVLVTGYQLSIDGGPWTDITTAGANPLTTTVSGLTNGTPYTFVIRALNNVGPSAPSNARTVTPYTLAQAPTLNTAVRGNASADLTFDAPAFDGGRPITRYEASADGGATWALIATTGTGPFAATLMGLANGTPYAVAVRAVTTAGPGAASNTLSVTPATTPGAPALSAATGGVQSVDLTFSAPASDGGDAITGYDVSQDNGATWQPLAALAGTASVTGLADNTTYTFIVHAVNTVGAGPSSGPMSATTATTPGAPTLNSATPGNGQVVLAFSAPASNGGSAITGYTISDGVTTISATSSPATFAGLSNGTQYTFSVTATNAVGASGASNTINATPVNPVTVPGTPSITWAYSYYYGYYNETENYVNFTVNDGGSPITAVELSIDGGAFVSLQYVGSYYGETFPNGTALNCNTAHTYQIRISNAVGTGAVSNARTLDECDYY